MPKKATGNKPVAFSPPIANQLVDLLDLHQKNKLGAGTKVPKSRTSQTSVRIENATGGNLDRGSVLRVDGHLYTSLSNYDSEHLGFSGDTPTTDQKYGILRKPTLADEIGELQVDGVCIARVLVNDETHTHAVPTPGQTYLTSAGDGPFVILDKPAGTGEVEAVVVFRSNNLKRFELTENLALGGEADAKILEWSSGAYNVTTIEIIVKDFTDTPGSWAGATGFQGWCIMPVDNDNGKHEIVWMETFAKFIEFTSTEDMGATTTGEMAVTVDQWYDIKEPTAEPVIVLDPHDLFRRVKSGASGKAWYDPKRDKYIIVECETKAGVIEFTLAAAFSSGSSTGATVNRYYGTQQDVQDPGSTETIYDDQGLFPRAVSGAKGIAVLDVAANKYRAVACQQLCITAKATLASDLCGGSSASITGFTATSPSPFNLAPSSLPTTAANPYAHRGLSGKAVWLAWDDALDDWVITDMEKVAATVIVGLGGTGPLQLSGGFIQGYTTIVAIEYCTAPAWENLLAVADCETE